MKTFQFLHRWLGVLAAIFILLFAISGIVLNHRSFFSGIDINRKFLPKAYHYQNWNLAAIKSATVIGQDSLLVYGNTGIWLTDPEFSSFQPFMWGMKQGIDNRRTTKIIISKQNNIIAGTMSGLYFLRGNKWQPISLPLKENRITGITQNQDDIWILTRSNLVKLEETPQGFLTELTLIPHPSDFKRETSLFRALWVIHSGKILGLPGKLLVDFLGLTLIFLCLSGLIWFAAPDIMKSLRNRIVTRKRFTRLNRFSLKWHNKLGIWLLGFLAILTVTGMFLRPPLLLTIIQSSFPKLKYTILDHPNPWYDKLREIQYDRHAEAFLISTSEGFYYAEPSFSDSLRRVPSQPPISVMGINVFEQPSDGLFITGSFNGIHQWIPSTMQVTDFITGQPIMPARGMANPFGNIPVAGYINLDGKTPFIFDYSAGIVSLNRNIPAPAMPDYVSNKSPIPLWNLALEVHTGRFYSFIFGDYYILFIPLAGLIILTLLISGIALWIKEYRRKKKIKSNSKSNYPNI